MSSASENELDDAVREWHDEDFIVPSQRAIRAAYRGDRDLLTGLLNDGYDINSIDTETGMAALHVAVGRNDLTMVKFLVERGAGFFPDWKGRWPSTIASLCEVSEELCDYIVDAEASAEGV